MPVYLLSNIAKESETSVFWDGGCERAQHLGREVLAFVNNYVAVEAFTLVELKLSEHGTGEVIPVVRLAALLPLIQVSRVKIE